MADFRDRSAMLLEELLDSGFRVEDAERLRDLLTVGCRNSAIEELKEKIVAIEKAAQEKEDGLAKAHDQEKSDRANNATALEDFALSTFFDFWVRNKTVDFSYLGEAYDELM